MRLWFDTERHSTSIFAIILLCFHDFFSLKMSNFGTPFFGRRLIFLENPALTSYSSNSRVCHTLFLGLCVPFQSFWGCVCIWYPKIQVNFTVKFRRALFRSHTFRFLKAKLAVVNYAFQRTSCYFFRISSSFLGALLVGKVFGPGTFSKNSQMQFYTALGNLSSCCIQGVCT